VNARPGRVKIPLVATVCMAGCLSKTSGPTSFAGLSNITLHGVIAYADGTPVRSRTVQFRLLGSGAGLFPDGVNMCDEGDRHAQALQTLNVVTAFDGSFSLTAPIEGFVRATDETCPMGPAAAAHLTMIDLKVQTDADQVSCGPYCKSHPVDTGILDCSQQGQKFVWSTVLTAGDVGAHLDIRLDELGPPLGTTSPPEPDLPDLQVDGFAAASSLKLGFEDFTAEDCEVQERCILAPGHRLLLRFDGVIQNLGLGDLVIGSPENNPLFVFSECHGHYHLKDIMTFELLDPLTGEVVRTAGGEVVSRKQGFCLKDTDPIAGDRPRLYDCENQGLTPGWADIYGRDLGCQGLDVTDVPGGHYTLRITVNAGRTFAEGNYGNNSALVQVSLL